MSTRLPAGAIVVAVDGSAHAERAVHWAAEQAVLERRPLVAVAVDEGEAQSILGDAEELVGRVAPGVDLHTVTATGSPRNRLIELSEQAHLLVMGSRGRGTIRSMLLGSVSATVSKYAACPVVVCRPGRADDGAHGVLVGADGSAQSIPVLEFAFAQASLREQDLTVVHCLWDVVTAVAGFRSASEELIESGEIDEVRLLLSESVAGFSEKYPDVAVTLKVANGLVDEALARHSAQWDLVVVGRHPLDTVGRVITGAISTAVLERAHTTVAVVPEAPGDES